MRIAAVVSSVLALAISTDAGAKRTECRATITGIPAVTGTACAGVTLCMDDPRRSCELHGAVRIRTKRGSTLRLQREAGSRCVVAFPEGEMTAAEPVRILARVGKGGRRRIRLSSVVSCPQPPRTPDSPADTPPPPNAPSGPTKPEQPPTGTEDPPPSDPPPPPRQDGECSGLTLPVPAVGRRAHFPPSIPTQDTCAGSSTASNYTNPPHLLPAEQAAELHVVGVYESDCSRMAPDWPYPCIVPREPITIVVDPRPKPIVLALTAYGAVTWQIDVRPGASVERVLVGGYETPSVTGVPAGIVETISPATYAYGWEVAHNTGGGGIWRLIESLRTETGLVETSFQGCYTGARFTIPYAADAPTTCEPSPVTGDETLAQSAVRFPECSSVEQESAACISAVHGGLALIGADSGTICPLAARGGAYSDPLAASIGWLGEVLYRCSHYDGLVRIDLRSGTSERLEMPCSAVTDDAGALLVAPGWQGNIFDWGTVYRVNGGYQGLLAANATRAAVSTMNSRFTAHGGLLYSAWHSTNTVDVQDIATGTTLRQVPLAGYDGWIFGLDVTDDGRLFVEGMDDQGTLLMIFDATTGTRFGEHRLGSQWGASGLACRATGASTTTVPTTTTSTTTLPPGGSSGGCIRSGCSGQVCADRSVGTTCEWREHYACYRTARCERQTSGSCGWTPTPELQACLVASGGSITPTAPPPD